MAKRGRKGRYTATTDNIKTQPKPGRLAKTARMEKGFDKNFAEDYTPREMRGHVLEQDVEPMMPALVEEEETGLATVELDPLYEAIAEMQARIQEAEQNLQRSQQARSILETEMDTVTKLAEDAESELAAAAKKAALLKHEAEQVCSQGLALHQQLSEEEQHWHDRLQEEQLMLTDTEQKLRIAEEESQRISHAKEVAARMNEREMWRLGSSKQGLWLQRRKVQGNALPMTRDKGGNWHMPKMVASPGATYAQTMLEREQKLQTAYGGGNNERLNNLSESAQALAERQSSQLEEGFLEQLAAREAARHLADAASSLAAEAAAPVVEEEQPPVVEEEQPVVANEEQIVVAEEQPVAAEEPAVVAEEQPVVEETPLVVAEEQPVEPTAPLLNEETLQALRNIESAAKPASTPAINEEQPAAPPNLNEDILRALRALETPQPVATPAPVAPAIMAAHPPVTAPTTAEAFTSQAEEDALQEAQNLPEHADPLQFLAMRAASYTASGQAAAAAAPQAAPVEPAPVQTAPAPAETAPAEPAAATVIPIQEEDIQRLAQQANILARQHLTQQQPQEAAPEQPSGRAKIAQKVAEETGRQDHLLKEQQTAEMAIAAAMAAARKAAQSAMAISEQVNQQMPALNTRGLAEEDRPYSVERIIADALSKAAVADQYRR